LQTQCRCRECRRGNLFVREVFETSKSSDEDGDSCDGICTGTGGARTGEERTRSSEQGCREADGVAKQQRAVRVSGVAGGGRRQEEEHLESNSGGRRLQARYYTELSFPFGGQEALADHQGHHQGVSDHLLRVHGHASGDRDLRRQDRAAATGPDCQEDPEHERG